MHISVRRYNNVVSVSEVCSKVATSFVPLLQKFPGFIAYYAIDGGEGTMVTISMFSTEQYALESNETALEWMRENVAHLQPEAPEIVAGKVRVEATA